MTIHKFAVRRVTRRRTRKSLEVLKRELKLHLRMLDDGRFHEKNLKFFLDSAADAGEDILGLRSVK